MCLCTVRAEDVSLLCMCVCLSVCMLNYFPVFCPISPCFLLFSPRLSAFLSFSMSLAFPLSCPHCIDWLGCKYLHLLKPQGSISVHFCLTLTRISFQALSVIGSLSFFFQTLFIIYIVCVSNHSSNFNISFKQLTANIVSHVWKMFYHHGAELHH